MTKKRNREMSGIDRANRKRRFWKTVAVLVLLCLLALLFLLAL